MDFLIPYSLDIALGLLIVIMVSCDPSLDVEDKSNLWGVGAIGLLAILAGSYLFEPTLLAPYAEAMSGDPGATAGWLWVLDPFALFFKRFFLLAGVFALLVVRVFAVRFRHGEGEYYALTLLAMLGGSVLASANDWIPLFVGLELMTITLMIMVSWARKDGKSLEAGMKYVIIGTFSSAFLLYGITYLYGYSGTTRLGYFAEFLDVYRDSIHAGVRFGILLVFAGIAFKMAVFPFHVWAPDVYEGAPTPTTAVLSVASKGAGFVLGLRFFVEILGPSGGSLNLLGYEAASFLGVIAALTICYGSLSAIPQWNIKRLMGYSSISHAGYLLIGVAVATPFAVTAVGYYLIAYLFTNFGLFLVLACVDRYTSDYEIDSLAGLGRRAPILGITFTFAVLSLAGIPPFGGFFAKLMLLMAAFESGVYWLALIGMVMVVVSMYVYLNLIKRIYAMEPRDPQPIEVDGWAALGCYVTCAGMLLTGLYQAPFWNAAQVAAQSLF